MSGFLFQYGTAAHLAILTVAPLFLSAFCGTAAQAVVLGWLSAFALLWIVMNPSPLPGEWPRDARRRIGWVLVRDPFLFFCIVAIVLSAICAINGGVEMGYSSATGLWTLKDPHVSVLPGSVSGCGLLPLAGMCGVAVVTLGVRHALGARARLAYLFLSGILAAAAVVGWRLLELKGVAVSGLVATPENPFSSGSLLAVYFLFVLVLWGESWSQELPACEILSAVIAAVLLAGLLFYAVPYVLWCVAPLSLLILVFGVIRSLVRRRIASWFRTAVSLLIILTPLAFLFLGVIPKPTVWPVFPDGFLALRSVASDVAVEAWKESTRFGVGLGSYPLALGFFAKPEDWQVLSVGQTAAPNGWIHFLFERGLLGAVTLLAGFGILLRDGILRYIRADVRGGLSLSDLLGPLVLALVIAEMFVDSSYAQTEALMSVGAAWALSAAALAESSGRQHG